MFILIDFKNKKQAQISQVYQYAANLMQFYILSEFNVKTLEKLNEDALILLFEIIRSKYVESLVDFGECVGVLASQSISEPLTQYMLDSHHRSVKGGTSKSGIIRPQEIFSVKPLESEQTPEMRICVKENADNFEHVQKVANSLEFIQLQPLY